jgi:hypothetical protein
MAQSTASSSVGSGLAAMRTTMARMVLAVPRCGIHVS